MELTCPQKDRLVQPMQPYAPVIYGNPYQQPIYSQPPSMVVQIMPGKEQPVGPSQCTGKYPEQFYCTSCRKNRISRVETSWGFGSCLWCMCCGVTLVVALLPCCIDGLRDVKHSCPVCQKTVGKRPCFCC